MPLKKLLFKSGVNQENTRLLNENGWYFCDKVRFRQGTPEKIGGWVLPGLVRRRAAEAALLA